MRQTLMRLRMSGKEYLPCRKKKKKKKLWLLRRAPMHSCILSKAIQARCAWQRGQAKTACKTLNKILLCKASVYVFGCWLTAHNAIKPLRFSALWNILRLHISVCFNSSNAHIFRCNYYTTLKFGGLLRWIDVHAVLWMPMYPHPISLHIWWPVKCNISYLVEASKTVFYWRQTEAKFIVQMTRCLSHHPW